jgi:ribosomal protein L7/L12
MKFFGGALEINWYGGLKSQVREFVKRGEIINAIKFVREKRPSWTLRQAKDYVDKIRDELRVKQK